MGQRVNSHFLTFLSSCIYQDWILDVVLKWGTKNAEREGIHRAWLKYTLYYAWYLMRNAVRSTNHGMHCCSTLRNWVNCMSNRRHLCLVRSTCIRGGRSYGSLDGESRGHRGHSYAANIRAADGRTVGRWEGGGGWGVRTAALSTRHDKSHYRNWQMKQEKSTICSTGGGSEPVGIRRKPYTHQTLFKSKDITLYLRSWIFYLLVSTFHTAPSETHNLRGLF